jgi:hypothetical protein
MVLFTNTNRFGECEMSITKTRFINFIRCPRYVALDKVHKEKLEADVSLGEYMEEERAERLKDMLDIMYEDVGEEDEEDLINTTNMQLETMMPYYNRIEILAGKTVNDKLPGTPEFAEKTKDQVSFSAGIDGIEYLCYVDICNKREDSFDIIEVKATTSRKFAEMGFSHNKQNKTIFYIDKDGIYHLKDEAGFNGSEKELETFRSQRSKLLNRFDKCGRYVYDLAVQRYIIEKQMEGSLPDDVGYYLAVLNHEYIYDGNSYDDIKDYEYAPDAMGNEIICLIDFTNITGEMMKIIDSDRKTIEKYISALDASQCDIGVHCEHKSTTKCKYWQVCSKHIPGNNSIFNYIDGHHGFIDEDGNRHARWDMVNAGKVGILDVPAKYLNRPKNQIQREVVESGKEYMVECKIGSGLKKINYPVYHLDFESFPCPLPRHKGEKPYSQSLFQFSIHVEHKPGECDKDADHYEFLAPDLKDHREELVKKLCECIKDDGGTVLTYNQSFEKTRIRELSEIFLEYKERLEKINERIFDLLFLIKSNTKFYMELGYPQDEAKLFNYYHKDLSGSFSIKKVLPVLSDLTYDGMEVSGGMEAVIAYASFPNIDEKTYDKKYRALIDYCKQDTWAMVEVLGKLREMTISDSPRN